MPSLYLFILIFIFYTFKCTLQLQMSFVMLLIIYKLQLFTDWLIHPIYIYICNYCYIKHNCRRRTSTRELQIFSDVSIFRCAGI